MAAAPSLLNPRPVRELIAEAPLVPVAVAATIGLMADRYLGLPPALDVLLLLAGIASWVTLSRRREPAARTACCIAVAAAAALWHFSWRHFSWPDDISHYVTAEPTLVRVRGVLDEEPSTTRRLRNDVLMIYPRPDVTHSLLDVREVLTDGGWISASGRVRLTVDGLLTDFHIGDEVEVFGWLEPLRNPLNPGEFDWADHLRDQRVRAVVRVRRTSAVVTRLAEGWSASPRALLAQLRGRGKRVIERELPAEQVGIAEALLLGDDSAMTTADWDRYIRTGVVHVLAISGQHLAVMAVALGFVLRRIGMARCRQSLLVAIVLVGYALLTGFHSPVQRATVIAVTAALSVMMRRLPIPANSFALAWLVVLMLDPTEPFNLGCQLSFLCVALLTWFVDRVWETSEVDPLDQLIEQTRSPAVRFLRRGFVTLGQMYLTSLILGIAVMPLIAARQNVVSPVGLVIGPPVIVLSSIALIAGFLMLLAALLGLAAPFALITRLGLAGCDSLAAMAERVPGGHLYVAGAPPWWLWGFYLALLVLLWYRPCWSQRRWFSVGGTAWALLALMAPSERTDELRVTFLAVGHGGCTVIEPPDGRVLVYDAGAMGGPDVTRRFIAPYLWSRGHRQIDELFLSHADLDHFNGVVELLERFDVARITLTPSFANKDLPGVQRTLAAIRDHAVPVRIIQAGDRLGAGEVIIDVLHPPPHGPAGEENGRSLVLRLQHGEHSILLTGDLQSPGLEQLTDGPSMPVDVLMAPHHGSPTSNTPRLAAWARPRLVVACDAKPRPPRNDDPYASRGIPLWVTGVEGAVTIRSGPRGLGAEAFSSGRFLRLKDPSSTVAVAGLSGDAGRLGWEGR